MLVTTSNSALEAIAIAALRRLHKIPDDAEAVFDIVAIVAMIEAFAAMIQQCQESKVRRGRRSRRSASDMLKMAQEPSRRVWVGAYRTARKQDHSRDESIVLVEVWIETARNMTLKDFEAAIEETRNPLAL